MKSTTPENEVGQIRGAVAQLLEYRFHRSARKGTLWVVLSCAPNLPWVPAFLESEGFALLWSDGDRLVGPSVSRLRELAKLAHEVR